MPYHYICYFLIYYKLFWINSQVGTWDQRLNMTKVPVTYGRPDMTPVPVTDVVSTCLGENCPHIEWWLYNRDYFYHHAVSNSDRTVSVYLNIHRTYVGEGECKGDHFHFPVLVFVDIADFGTALKI